MNATPNADSIADFVVKHPRREYPPDVQDAAKQCLVDWFGVCLGALAEPPAVAVHRMVSAWRSEGGARMLLGGRAAPVAAALVNGTLAHCLDYDDTHIESILHGSGPTWAATLAVGQHRNASERELLSAFITGFEVGTRVGNGGIGVRLNHSGWHTTCVLGRYSSAAAAAALLGLSPTQVKHALGIAATQVGGLTASVGTMAKPFHAGKTASDGVLAAELAGQDFEAAVNLLDSEKGLVPTLFQDASAAVHVAEFGTRWEITRNSFKPYAACQLTHGSIDCALNLREGIGSADVAKIRAYVNPLAIKLAGHTNASTPNEGKFSLAYTIALGLTGYRASLEDFTARRLGDTHLQALAARVETIASEDVERTGARIEVTLADGRTLTEETQLAFGSMGHQMQWPDLKAKFLSLAQPVIGPRAIQLFDVLRDFDQPGCLREAFAILDSRSLSEAPAAASSLVAQEESFDGSC
ncbi:MAG: MmgE/PrpD family protein [Burkholderiales bacterium]